ncbi:PilX N-terminal domain-containing pilus assembly protein [Endozoicomonas numazuensis]|uniref:Type 4 fimbrial biogenesis protein PilX N-terminal domain-containing protein n=1 Tax=Endozoicomonas numazuensis TaxID=1137799 RepID=A0A081N988_9GAMM|nr:PilX N-terminal domain-containing pilus assembly protein [Endozoicomonas numazuensis]KEQ15011.1 hypothetical protein GZ78_24310 [Endozoicomonas numazuensis]
MRTTSPNQQQGAILFISLIILLLVTIVAIGSTRLSTMGQRVSHNYQLKNTSFQAAESGLESSHRLLLSSSFFMSQADQAMSDPNSNGLESSFVYNDVNGGVTTDVATESKLVEKIVDSGNSLGVGKGSPQFYVYETLSTANIRDNNDVESVLERGQLTSRVDQ